MNLKNWTTTGLAITAALGLSFAAGCDQQSTQTDTYDYPETPSDTGTFNSGTDTSSGGLGDTGPMGTTQDDGMIGGQSDSAASGSSTSDPMSPGSSTTPSQDMNQSTTPGAGSQMDSGQNSSGLPAGGSTGIPATPGETGTGTPSDAPQ